MNRPLKANDWMIVDRAYCPVPNELIGLTPVEAINRYAGDFNTPPEFVYSEDFDSDPPTKYTAAHKEALDLLYDASIYLLPNNRIARKIQDHLSKHNYPKVKPATYPNSTHLNPHSTT